MQLISLILAFTWLQLVEETRRRRKAMLFLWRLQLVGLTLGPSGFPSWGRTLWAVPGNPCLEPKEQTAIPSPAFPQSHSCQVPAHFHSLHLPPIETLLFHNPLPTCSYLTTLNLSLSLPSISPFFSLLFDFITLPKRVRKLSSEGLLPSCVCPDPPNAPSQQYLG